MNTPRCKVGLLSLLLGAVLAMSLSSPASAQRMADQDVVMMMCARQGHTFVVTVMSPPQKAMEGLECAEALSELLRSGMRLLSTTGSERSGTVYTLRVPPLAPDELGLAYPLEARGCNCDDALPITGFTCQSCTQHEDGCACLFKKATP